MEGVLEATLFLCVCKLMFSVLLCLPSVVRTFTAAGLCCICLLLFTDLIIALILIYVRITECWSMPFQVSSEVIALRFLLFLCRAYEVVMLLTPPLIAVELLVNLLGSQDSKEDAKLDKDVNTLWISGASLSQTIGYISCLFVWIMSGFYSSNNLMLSQLSTENCLERGSCLMNCLPGFPMTQSPGQDELSWIVPGVMLLLSLTGGLGLLKTKAHDNTLIHRAGSKEAIATKHTHIQQPIFNKGAHLYPSPNLGTDSEKTPDSCAIHRAGYVYNEERWFCPGNVALCTYQTGFVQQQKLPTGHAPFFPYKTKLLQEITSLEVDQMQHCDYKKTQTVLNEALETQRKHHEMESPCLGEEMLRGLVCAVLVCVFPTAVSCNVLLILNLETLVVHSVKLLSLSAHKVCAL